MADIQNPYFGPKTECFGSEIGGFLDSTLFGHPKLTPFGPSGDPIWRWADTDFGYDIRARTPVEPEVRPMEFMVWTMNMEHE